MPNRLEGDYHFSGTLTAKRFGIPEATITDAMVSAASPLGPTKTQRHQSVDAELFAEGAAIIAVASKLLHIVRGDSGSLIGFEAIIGTQATGGDRTVTVDLQKSTAGGTFATVLTTTINITNATAVRTPVAAAINTAALVDGDILRAVVTVAGAAGAQAAGLLISLTMSETYN